MRYKDWRKKGSQITISDLRFIRLKTIFGFSNNFQFICGEVNENEKNYFFNFVFGDNGIVDKCFRTI